MSRLSWPSVISILPFRNLLVIWKMLELVQVYPIHLINILDINSIVGAHLIILLVTRVYFVSGFFLLNVYNFPLH
jgi:hypothetical protein